MLMSYLLFNPARKLLKDRQDRIESDINTAVADCPMANCIPSCPAYGA